MSSFTLTNNNLFPNGTTVKAYATTNWPTPAEPSGAPIGSSSAEATMTAGTLTFSGLTLGTRYWAVAEVGGKYRYEKFIAGEDLSIAAAEAQAYKLLPFVNVTDVLYGATGDGSTDDASAIQAAINAVSEAGGGTVIVPRGTFIIGTALQLKSKVHLRGVGPEATILKLKNSASTDVITSAGYGSTGADNFSIRDLSVDGNKANNASGGTGMKLDGRRIYASNFHIFNCKTDGLNVQQTASDLSASEGGSDSMFDHFHVWGCTNYGVFNNIHDAHFTDGFCVGNAATNFYVGSSGSATVINGVHAWGAATYGFRFDASYDAVNCEAEGASSAQVFINVDAGRWIGGRAFVATSPTNVCGFEWNTSKGFNTTILGVLMKGSGTAGALKFTGSGSGSVVTGFYEESGVNPLYTGSPGVSVDLSRLRRLGNATLPARTTASASTMAINCEPVVEVTGTTEIKKITVPANYPPIVVLKFAGSVKVVKGENLKLKENFEATELDTLTLACDGTNYTEIGRSAN